MNNQFICYHYDIARGAYLKPEIFKEALRLAAESGYTHFLPYLENMIKLPSMEKACPDCAYTLEQWHEFDRVAEEHNIELMPHFNVIGHSKQICEAYPELTVGPEGFELDVSSDAVKKWTANCLEEYCLNSKGKYFLIGGDEWQTPNQLLADSEFNVAKSWAEQINLATEVLVRHQRIPVVWHDMLLHYPEAIELLDKNNVIAFWFYDEDSDHPVIDMLKKSGLKTIMATGLCSCFLGERRKRAVNCALRAAEKYDADGFMVTSWEDGRWEKQKANIPMIGQLIRGGTVPDTIVAGATLADTIRKLNPGDQMYVDLTQRLKDILSQSEWSEFPEYHEYLTALGNNDRQADLTSFLKYHYPEGPWHERLCAEPAVTPAKSREVHVSSSGFGLTEEQHAQFGPVLKINNEKESFIIYPKYSGSLQSWYKEQQELIPHSLPEFVEKSEFLPGGYRSYSGVGGLRPIWAFGSFHNPCILWQGPFSWEIIENSEEKIIVALKRSLYHVDVNYRITVQKGKSGFTYEIEAVNKIDKSYGTFGFNLPFSLNGAEDYLKTSFKWRDSDGEHTRDLKDSVDSFFVIDAPNGLTIDKENVSLKIESDPDKTAGFYVDWSMSYITPDLRGKYCRLNRGDSYCTQWSFSTVS